jgi:type IV pilus assembly protein PilQ
MVNRTIAVGILALLLSVVTAPRSAHARKKQPVVSLSIKDAPIESVLTFIAREAGWNLVLSDGISGRVTMTLNKVPAEAAFRAVLKTHSLEVVRTGPVRVVMTRDQYLKRLDAMKRRR